MKKREGSPALASRAVFAARFWRNAVWALAIIGGALAVGMAGYGLLGPMPFWQAFANAAMILSGMGPLDKLEGSNAGFIFEGVYALVCGLLFFAVAGLVLAPAFHRLLHRFHLEDSESEGGKDR
jgi:sterol desaturase/sphingolipid hydroxylase (fatty acid hydroxylase superfamily)